MENPVFDHLRAEARSYSDPTQHAERHRSSTQIVELQVDPTVAAVLSAVASREAFGVGSIETAADDFGDRAGEVLRRHLPRAALEALEQLAEPSQTTAVVLRGLSRLEAPATPTEGFLDDEVMRPHDFLLAGVMRLAGTRPVAFTIENRGRIARNVVANPQQAGYASSHGFNVELFYHQDNCGQPFEGEGDLDSRLPPMPYQLGFMTLRNHEAVPTRLLLVDDVLEPLSEATLAALARPSYRIGAPDSVVTDGFDAAAIEDAPILRREGGSWACRFDPFLVTPADPAAAAANARLILALAAARHQALDVVLHGGDVMVFKNYRLLHMRVAFVPEAAPRSRWLRRFYGGRRA
jgi:hypothetical protein